MSINGNLQKKAFPCNLVKFFDLNNGFKTVLFEKGGNEEKYRKIQNFWVKMLVQQIMLLNNMLFWILTVQRTSTVDATGKNNGVKPVS